MWSGAGVPAGGWGPWSAAGLPAAPGAWRRGPDMSLVGSTDKAAARGSAGVGLGSSGRCACESAGVGASDG
eukprot:1009992-Alexandrium_andersonii.AAC.1